MIGVRLVGGLGNQMFQYAAGLALAERLNTELRCDSHHYRRHDDRALGLREFGLDWQECRSPSSASAIARLAIRLGVRRTKPFRPADYFEEASNRYNRRFEQLSGTCYLDGFFQSWRYFAGHEESVRSAFDLERIALTHAQAQTASAIAATGNAVAVHIRRGDYTNPATLAYHGLLGRDYYDAARQQLEALVGEAEYFVFSDDPAAAAEMLRDWPRLTLVAGGTPHQELKLMALCRHFIIANSSFSWWGAWLARDTAKTVVGPRQWFSATNPAQTAVEDRFPPDWQVAG